MSRAQRLSFLAIAAVIAVVAVVLLGGSGDDEETTGANATATATATATADTTAEPDATATGTPTPTPTPKPLPPLLETGKVTKLRFEQGGTVRFRVRSKGAEEIHVHGYDVTKTIPAGRTVNVSFPARITGIFEIEFHGTGEEIAQLRVDPD